jgi:phosphate transport system substrate-binding protein
MTPTRQGFAGDHLDPATLDPGWGATGIAWDGIAVIVHPDNPVNELGLLQLGDIFGGQADSWQQVPATPRPRGGLGIKRVQPISREQGSGTRAAFEALAMEGRRVTPNALVMPSSQAVIDHVSSSPEAIAYVSMGYLTPLVKAVRIEGELPTPTSARLATYVLSRMLWLVAREQPTAPVQDFTSWVVSPAGQQIVGQSYGRLH